MHKLILLIATAAVLANAGGIQIRPLQKPAGAAVDSAVASDSVVARLFDDDYIGGGYNYTYPEATSKITIPEGSGIEGEVAVCMNLDAKDYSGGAVCVDNMYYDLRPYYDRGALQFWIKADSASFGGKCFINICDDDKSDGFSTELKVPLAKYADLTDEWQQITIPLHDFGLRGVYWDEGRGIEIPTRFQWDKLNGFVISIEKGINKKFLVWVDDIKFVRDRFEPIPERKYWDEIVETVVAPPAETPVTVKAERSFYKNTTPLGGFSYIYGGRTAMRTQKTDNPENEGLLALYLDNAEYSGASIGLGVSTWNLAKAHNGRGALGFWAKFTNPDIRKFFVSFLDDESDKLKVKVQTTVSLADFGPMDTNWNYYIIPLKTFTSRGAWWDEIHQVEVPGVFDWTRINEFSVSINKFENRIDATDPLVIYLDDIAILDDAPGWVDPADKWQTYRSDAPDTTLMNFEAEEERAWEAIFGDKSDITMSYPADKEDKTRFGKYVMKVEYRYGDWLDLTYGLESMSYPAELRDWSKYWGVALTVKSDNPKQQLMVAVVDTSGEVYTAVTKPLGRGWQDIIVPFKDFEKQYTNQPAEANENAVFDLEAVKDVSINPAPGSTKGSYLIGSVGLTNKRQ